MNDTRRHGPRIVRALLYSILLGGIAVTALVFWQSRASYDFSGVEIRPSVHLEAATLDSQELVESIAQIVAELCSDLEQIQDEPGAHQLESAIEDATKSVIAMRLERISESIQAECLASVKPTVEGLMQALKRPYRIPGVQAILEPMVSPMLSRLQAFAQIEVD